MKLATATWHEYKTYPFVIIQDQQIEANIKKKKKYNMLPLYPLFIKTCIMCYLHAPFQAFFFTPFSLRMHWFL